MTASQQDKVKLLVVTSSCDRPETELFSRLTGDGLDVHMFCSHDAPSRSALSNAGVNITDFEALSRLDHRAAHMLSEYVVENSIDVVYAPRTFLLTIAIWALRNSNARLIGYRGTTGHLGFFDFGTRLTYASRRLDRIVCVSEAVKIYLQNTGISPSKLITIPKGHSSAWYQPAKRSSLTDLGIPEDAFVVGFAGHVRKVKGVKYLLRALKHIPEQMKVHILIAGEMENRQVQRLALSPALRNQVHCTGFISDAPSLMGACDAFAMPSLRREGMPRALIEAMAQGVPPIASRAGGIPEIIENGVSGLLVPPKDDMALGRCIIELAQNRERARQLGSNAKARIEEHFHINTTVDRMKQLFLDDSFSRNCPQVK